MTNQPGLNQMLFIPFGYDKTEALFAVSDITCPQPRVDLAGHRPKVRDDTFQGGCQSIAFGIINIHNGRHQTNPSEQGSLGLPVGGHGPVIVQMVLRKVGENGRPDWRTVQAPLLNAY